MKLIDSHCHLESEELFDDLDKIIQGASKAGIVKLITCSVNYEQWDKSKSIAERYDEVEFANGIHPWYASVSDLDKIEELADSKSRGAVAIGEIGIDKKIDNPSYEIQKEIFIRQMEIACDIDLPVILHARGTSNELYKILKSTGIPKSGGVIHSFSGSAEQAEDFIKLFSA